MSGELLLDTNIAIAVLRGEEGLEVRLDDAPGFLSVIALGELYLGALKSGQSERNLAKVDELAARLPVLHCDEDTARRYGDIRSKLERVGRPIPENDIWIAATARQHGLVLVTRDRHFAAVENLQVEAW